MADAASIPTDKKINTSHWPSWAKRLRNGMLIATALIGTAAGLAVATEKLGYDTYAACTATGLCKPAIPIPQIRPYTSGFVPGGQHRTTSDYCDPQKRILDAAYPDFNILMTYLPEEHRTKGGIFKKDEYKYNCAFNAIPKNSPLLNVAYAFMQFSVINCTAMLLSLVAIVALSLISLRRKPQTA